MIFWVIFFAMDITNILKDKIMLAVEKLENQSVLPKDLKKDSIIP